MRHAIRAFLALVLAGVTASVARAQLSPGPLSAAHADLDRATSCFQCHGRGGTGAMDTRCLACHTEVGTMIRANRGFHAREGKAACAKCHPDHAGRDFQLVRWDDGRPEAFDHRRAGYALEGKHAAAECASCHQPKNQRSAAAKLIRKKDRAKSWLGLEHACTSCHEDPHRAQLGADCLQCHGMEGWKPAPRFDHAKTAYALTGRHADVACAKCHAAEALALPRDAKGEVVPRWKPLAHGDCASCHKDPHAGRFKGACAACHTTDDFKRVKTGGFNHDQTRYPLRGKHALVACASCHDPKAGWGAKPAFATCGSCHRDAHAGNATLAGKPADCAACHDVQGWRPSTYTAERHRASTYPLEGAHAGAACALCHAKDASAAALARLGPARVEIRPAHGACVDCHHDPHGGRFSAGGERPRGRACLACHSLAGFRPAGVDVAAHDGFRFKLEGAHRAIPCQACHAELRAAVSAGTLRAAAATARPLRFTEKQRACADCHKDPHGDQFAARADRGACDGCHVQDAWRPASRFDHRRDASYKLEGAHLKVACAGCHPAVRQPNGASRVLYRPIPSRCEDCHTVSVPSGPGLEPGRMGARVPSAPATLPTTHEVTHGATLR